MTQLGIEPRSPGALTNTLSILNPRSSHTKDSKMVLDASELNTQHYKARIKGKMEQFREKSSALPYTLV